MALANLAGEYDKATVVIDGVFEGPVYTLLTASGHRLWPGNPSRWRNQDL